MPQIEVLHRGRAHDRGRIDRLAAAGHRGDVHRRIVVRQRVEPRVVAERTLQHQRLTGVDVALEDQVRFGRHHQVAGDRPRQSDRAASQKAREHVLVDVGREGGRRRVDRGRVTSQHDRHRHALAPPRHLPPVSRAHLVALPVHRAAVPVQHLHPVHPDVAHPGSGVARHHLGERDVGAAVVGPAREDGKRAEVDLRAPQHDLLARRRGRRRAGRIAGHLGQSGEERQLLPPPVRHLELEHLRNAGADLVQVLDAQRERHPPDRPEEVDPHGHVGHAAVAQDRPLEEQRRSAAGALHAPIRDLRDLVPYRDLPADPHQLVRILQTLQELAQGVGHARRPQYSIATPIVRDSDSTFRKPLSATAVRNRSAPSNASTDCGR